jgi:transposase-like protein
MSRGEFDRRFPDDDACARYLAEKRWPNGFVCPRCEHDKGWALTAKPHTWECARCHRQTSVTAGTVMHRSKLPLKTWFYAIHLVTSHSNGISAEQAQAQLGIRSYATAWLLLQKLRRAMVNPDRTMLADLVEVDETTVPFRTKEDPVAGGQGRSHEGKLAIIAAVELSEDGQPRRIRLQGIEDYTRETLHGFINHSVARGARVITDGLAAYKDLPNHDHRPIVVGKMAAHIPLQWVHRVFSNLKRWFTGTLHGVRKPHLQRYLDEFAFRWNRRRHTATAFDTLIGLALRLPHASERDFVLQRV